MACVMPTTTVRPTKQPRKPKGVYYSNVANIVCLFWFNDKPQLDAAFERGCISWKPSTLSAASSEFKEYIKRVLQQTQLPATAVSLALLYILRLKTVSTTRLVGNKHSEYRIFSVAMILANKFLDDNTYTNKTWADITKLPLKEISAMEIEFLTNMRYNLVVGEAEWTNWQQQLKTWLNVAYQAQHWLVGQSICGGTVSPPPPLPVLPVDASRQVPSPSINYTPIATPVQSNSYYLPAAPPPSTQFEQTQQLPTPPSMSPVRNYDVNLKKRGFDDYYERPNKRMCNNTVNYSSPYAPLYPVRQLLAPECIAANSQNYSIPYTTTPSFAFYGLLPPPPQLPLVQQQQSYLPPLEPQPTLHAFSSMY